jgi:predicted O-methyltransferase YrrM
MAKFRSYVHALTAVLEHILSRSPSPVIVEYGPGYSTILMKHLAPAATIVTMEDRKEYYEKCREQFAEAKLAGVTLLIRDVKDGYVTAPDELVRPGTADLVYVDARKRAACLRHARTLAKPGTGIVVLHDAERPVYRLGFWRWPRSCRIWQGGFMNWTLVLMPDRESAAILRARISQVEARGEQTS